MIFIAECGINYAFGKDKSKFLDNAKAMIDMVVNARDIAKSDIEVICKFQKRDVDKAVSPEQKLKGKEVPWRDTITTYYQYKLDIEFTKEELDELDRYCNQKNIKWTTSVWDIDSAIFIKDNYQLPFIKIPSAKITDTDLLEYCNENFQNVVISTGMSNETEIAFAIAKLSQCNLSILHCNSSYPAEDTELNLSYIKSLKAKYKNHTIGYSGHEEGISACIIAKSVGADIIERHITLSRSYWGTDQAASIVYDQLWRLLRDLAKVDLWLGDGVKQVYDSEIPIRKKLRG